MKTLFGWAFDMWRNMWFSLGVMVDGALDIWDFGDDEEDQW